MREQKMITFDIDSEDYYNFMYKNKGNGSMQSHLAFGWEFITINKDPRIGKCFIILGIDSSKLGEEG